MGQTENFVCPWNINNPINRGDKMWITSFDNRRI